MIRPTILLLTLFLIDPSNVSFAGSPKPTPPIDVRAADETITIYLVILDSGPDYERILRSTKAISQGSGIPYDPKGNIYDKDRGLHLRDDDPDEMYAGQYYHRRFNGDKDHISIEYSDYEGLKDSKIFIVLGGIQEDLKAAKKMLAMYAKHSPKAHLHKTSIYIGCIH